MKKDHFVTFAAGIIVGTLCGVLLQDNERKRIQQATQALSKKAAKLRKTYEDPIKESVKKFITRSK